MGGVQPQETACDCSCLLLRCLPGETRDLIAAPWPPSLCGGFHWDGCRNFAGQPAPAPSGHFKRGWGYLQLDVLGAEIGMVSGEAHLAGLFCRAKPDSACAADQRKRIVADE